MEDKEEKDILIGRVSNDDLNISARAG